MLIDVGEPAVEPLKTLLENHDEQLHHRELILGALGRIATIESIRTILDILHTDLSGKALSVLKEVGERAAEPLISAMDGANQDSERALPVFV